MHAGAGARGGLFGDALAVRVRTLLIRLILATLRPRLSSISSLWADNCR